MATKTNRLTARGVQTITKPGRHADGQNLYLNVTKTGSRSWVLFYRLNGRMREMGLGNARDVSLSEARALAATCRRALRSGTDPIEARRTNAAKPSFSTVAEELIASKETEWRNLKHRAQWRSTLASYAAPIAGKPVDSVTTEDVLAILKPLWTKRPETASRVRGRIEAVLDAAKAKGLRSGDNPAAWRGHLDKLLSRRSKLTRGHHAAMAIDALPSFMAALREANGVSARALEFTIATATRSGEARGARWSEIDMVRATWTVPPERMKAGVEHRVPLCERAIQILNGMQAVQIGVLIFPGARSGRPLSDMALAMVLRRLKVNVTVHGFRSTFRDWASEETSFSHEVCEAALAHTIKNKAEAAYRRGDLFEKRRQLMAAWDRRCRPIDGAGVVMASARHG